MAQDEIVTVDNSFMYFMAKGECTVTISDRLLHGAEDIVVRVLKAGDHFGVS